MKLEKHFWWLAFGLALICGALRWKIAASAPWYWDEGYVAELTQSLAQAKRPSLGAMWQDGFFPLSTSLLAPFTAQPFISLFHLEPLTAVRLWAVLLQMLTVLALASFGRRLAGAPAGLLAAAIFALHPFSAEFGARGFYHHFPALMLLLSVNLLLAKRLRLCAFCAGMALASAYWLWWALPLLAFAWLREHSRGAAFEFAVWSALPMVFVGLNFLPDPGSTLWSLQSLLNTAGAGAPKSLAAFGDAVYAVARQFPFLFAGLLGLGLAAWAEPRRGWLPLMLGLGCLLEPLRQRGSIVGMPYPFILGLPWLYLGLALAVHFALKPGLARKAGLALACAAFLPIDLEWMKLWSVEGARAHEMAAALKQMAPAGSTVLGLPNYNWALKPALQPIEPFDLGAFEQRHSGFYLPPVPAGRFAVNCPYESVRYLVACRVHFMGLMKFPGVAETFSRIEAEKWPEVWSNKSFKIFQNPRFHGPATGGLVFRMPAEEAQP